MRPDAGNSLEFGGNRPFFWWKDNETFHIETEADPCNGSPSITAIDTLTKDEAWDLFGLLAKGLLPNPESKSVWNGPFETVYYECEHKSIIDDCADCLWIGDNPFHKAYEAPELVSILLDFLGAARSNEEAPSED